MAGIIDKLKAKPLAPFAWTVRHCAFLFKNDEIYLRLLYFFEMGGRVLHLKNPKTFNEKLQWLKLYNRKPEHVTMVDKYEAKKYVESIVGSSFIIPTIGVWDDPDEIDWESLPQRFVLKVTHDSGGLVICKAKAKFDIAKAKEKLRKALNHDYFMTYREWPYKNVPRRIIAEEYIEDSHGELNDYKIFCFNGEPKFVQVDYGRHSKHGRNIYDMDWKFMKFMNNIHYPYDEGHVIEKPVNFEKMVELAKRLSSGEPHLRVDFYNLDGKIYFGELTFFHGSGLVTFRPKEWDRKIGDWLKLPLN